MDNWPGSPWGLQMAKSAMIIWDLVFTPKLSKPDRYTGTEASVP